MTMPATRPLPCGRRFCGPVVRMLWPITAFLAKDIAEITGVKHSAITRRVDQLGIREQRPQPKRHVFSRALFRKLWADPSLTRRDIAKQLGVHKKSLAEYANAMGLPPKPSAPPGTGFIYSWPRDFNAMWIMGVAAADIASLVGCSVSLVSIEARRRNLKPRGTSGPRPPPISMQDYRRRVAMVHMRHLADQTAVQLLFSDMVTGINPTHVHKLAAQLAA